MPRKKPARGQAGFAFLPPEIIQPKIIEGKMRCLGPRCKRISPEGLTWAKEDMIKDGRVCKICNAEFHMLKHLGVTLLEFKEKINSLAGLCGLCRVNGITDHPLACMKDGKLFSVLCDSCYDRWRHFPWMIDHPEWIEKAMGFKERYEK